MNSFPQRKDTVVARESCESILKSLRDLGEDMGSEGAILRKSIDTIVKEHLKALKGQEEKEHSQPGDADSVGGSTADTVAL